ncbi:hypothetical protein ACCD08_29490, partial [Telluria sp. Tellsp104]
VAQQHGVQQLVAHGLVIFVHGGAGAGGLALAWVPLSAMFWTVALLYAVAAVGMRAIRTRSSDFQHLQTTTGTS